MSSTEKINEETRAIYHRQHSRVVNDPVAMRRFLNMIQEEYFGLENGFFKTAKILDAGCGDTAKLLIRFSQFGCKDLTGIDLGTDFIPIAEKNLKNHNVPATDFKLISASVDKLPFEDQSFDFVCCHGVLLHLADFSQIERAFSELARVTKKGGYLYTVYGLYGGLLEAIYPAIREYYRNNSEFREFIDNVSPENFKSILTFMNQGLVNQGDKGFNIDDLVPLFDVDFCVTMQNIIQAPVRNQISPQYVEEKYSQHGFEKPRQLKRYVHRENIRKFFAPLHFDRENLVSKILYGSGNLEFIARKK